MLCLNEAGIVGLGVHREDMLSLCLWDWIGIAQSFGSCTANLSNNTDLSTCPKIVTELAKAAATTSSTPSLPP
jgi:hypothetical protein